MTTSFRRRALLFLLAIVFAARTTATARPPSRTRYNVLIVSLDSVRRDLLGSYGYRSALAPGLSPSPRLDRLAGEGVLMTEAYASAPWTLPSHISLMTGEAPMVHLVENDLQRLPPARHTLAEILRSGGWRTAGVFSGPYLEPLWGFDRGFERYHAAYGLSVAHATAKVARLSAAVEDALHDGSRRRADALNWKRRTLYEWVRNLSHGDVSSDTVTTAALGELERLAGGADPWFLFVHYFDPHYDYIPPAPWDTRFDPGYHGTVDGHGFFSNPAIAVPDPDDPDRWLRRVGARDLDHVRALYAGELGWVDAHVGRLLDRLDALGVADRTLVVVLADHGDEFFEHGGIGHRRTVFDEVLRIPLLLRLPGVLPRGRTVDGLVSIADVFPTVLDLLGVRTVTDLGATSFAGLLRGARDRAPRSVFARLVRLRDGFMTVDGTQRVPARLVIVEEAFRTGSIKIVRRRRWPFGPAGLPAALAQSIYEASDEAYRQEQLAWVDLERSPGEAPDAFSTDFGPPAARAALDAFMALYARLTARASLRFDSAEPLGTPLRQKLTGLGYVEAEDDGSALPVRAFVLPLPGDTSTHLAE